MTINFRCPGCNRAFQVADSMAGTSARCTSCKQVVHVPKPAPKVEQAPAAIEFQCHQCRQAFRVGQEWAGKNAKCQGCGSVVTVPGGNNDLFDDVLPPAPAAGTVGNPLNSGASRTLGSRPAPTPQRPYASNRQPAHSSNWFRDTAAHWARESSDEHALKTYGFAILGVVLTLCLPFSLVGTYTMIVSAHTASSWPVTQGTIVASKVGENYRRRGGRTYDIEVKYKFTIDGKEYESNRVRYLAPSSRDRSEMERLATLYTPGSTHNVSYDPEDPNECVLDASFTPFVYVSLILPFLCLMGPIIAYTSIMASIGKMMGY